MPFHPDAAFEPRVSPVTDATLTSESSSWRSRGGVLLLLHDDEPLDVISHRRVMRLCGNRFRLVVMCCFTAWLSLIPASTSSMTLYANSGFASLRLTSCVHIVTRRALQYRGSDLVPDRPSLASLLGCCKSANRGATATVLMGQKCRYDREPNRIWQPNLAA